jgi:succinate-semialdehyde dehydrogenase/glutarate-semialdehyde dehydrogenase
VGDEFTEAFVSKAKELKLGDGLDPGTDIGPLINERRQEAAHRLVQDAQSRGAVLALGGGRGDHERGYFYEPSVLVDADPSMAVMNEEPFAPVAPIMRFRRLEDALAEANRTPYGLASFVYTSDLRTAVLASEGLEAGMVGVNTMLIATAEAPFGGVKMSGYGREGGPEGVDEYTVAKYVNISL